MNIPAKVRNGIFAILLSSCIVSSMVHTVLNTALFPIMEEFDISAARAQWLITAFSLVMGVMVLATASLIRRFPNRPLYLTFMGLFCLGLLLSAAAPSFSAHRAHFTSAGLRNAAQPDTGRCFVGLPV